MMMNICIILVNILVLSSVESISLKCATSLNKPAPCIVMGEMSEFDDVLYDTVREKSAIPLIKRDEDFVFPLNGMTVNWTRITSLRVTNELAAGDEGTVTLTKGGVDYPFLTLHLESQRGSGYNFHIVIRGV